jgi:transposase InsO family protein
VRRPLVAPSRRRQVTRPCTTLLDGDRNSDWGEQSTPSRSGTAMTRRGPGIRVSRKRVARLMRNAGLVAVSRRKSTVTSVRDRARQAPDLVDRNFRADQPNRRHRDCRTAIGTGRTWRDC